MAVVELQLRARSPLADGASFGRVGPYERLDGTIRFAVDPAHPANRCIVDLDRAAGAGDGLAHFQGDFCLVQPTDPTRGNGRLLFDVVNRGRKVAVRLFNRLPSPAVPTEEIDLGDEFLMRRGWTIAWCGWQWDVVPGPGLMAFEAPQALAADGQPIQGQVLCEFQPVDRDRDRLLADRIHHPYVAADTDDPEAELAVRDWTDGPRTVIPRSRWRFARDENGRPVPDDRHIWLEGGFEPGRVYEVIYRTRVCPVVGTGLLAVRDTVSFLRHGTTAAANPCAGRIQHTYGFGMSQSGRFLRHFLYLGLNVDEAGRQVFDGLNIHVAGARRGEFNHRYGQPSSSSIRSFGHLPPFHTDQLLERQRAVGGVPRIVETNTTAEYWRGDCSLLHTDPEGVRDVEPPTEVRLYHFAGTQHGPGRMPPEFLGPDGSRSANPSNVVDYAPLLRAALENLDQWVSGGVEPPASSYPHLSDGTAVTRADALQGFSRIRGIAVPLEEQLPTMPRVEVGPDAARGVGSFPATIGEAYRTYVPAVDADGNELAGIRHPDLVVPVATYTGWNLRDPETGGTGQIISMLGSTFPFLATEEERARTSDPRPAILARYKDLDDYLARVRAAAEELVGQRYLLPEDVDVVVDTARERYQAYVG